MANRRMFSKTIVDSDDFLDMPVSARLLYYDLGMRADDDGFVNPKRVMRLTGASDDDLKVLLAKKYVLVFENKVLVIRDWKVNNFIRPDRYTPTIYKEYLKQLKIQETNQYILTSGIPNDIPKGDPVKGSIELGKSKVRKGKILSGKPDKELTEKYINSNTRKDIRIIFLYARAKGKKKWSSAEENSFITRNLKSAKLLEAYSYERIMEVMKYLNENADFKWTIETIGKYIDENLEKLNGRATCKIK